VVFTPVAALRLSIASGEVAQQPRDAVVCTITPEYAILLPSYFCFASND